jgi:ribose-phosphate pyrophosphokinase
MSLIVFASASYAYLQRDVCEAGGFEMGAVERTVFPDGERYQRIVDDVADEHVAILGGTISDTDTLEIFDLACTAVKEGARTLTLVLPYFGYGTMERAVKRGEVVTAKARAMLFSALPRASDGNRVAMIDLHAEGIPHYFEGSVRPVHLYAKPVILEAIRELAAGSSSFVLGSTDAGRAKWVESLANEMGVNAGFVFKRRISGLETEVRALSADVRGRDVILYDDMIRTGSSLLHAAEAYRGAGATRVFVVATHGLFPADALARLRASGAVERVVCTDTHPRAIAQRCDFLDVKSVAPLVAEFLARRAA